MTYTMARDGFQVLPGFFDIPDLAAIRAAVQARIPEGATDHAYGAYISFTRYDVLSAADLARLPALQRMAVAVREAASAELSLYNSLYLELHAAEADRKPGFAWHQDVTSF